VTVSEVEAIKEQTCRSGVDTSCRWQ